MAGRGMAPSHVAPHGAGPHVWRQRSPATAFGKQNADLRDTNMTALPGGLHNPYPTSLK